MVFVKIRFGDSEEIVANPNCSEMNLLNYVADLCYWDGVGSFDLCDTKGHLKGLGTHQNANALSFLNHTETYVPVTGRKTVYRGNACTEYIVLLTADDVLYGKIRESLNALEASKRKTMNKPRLSVSPASDTKPSKLNIASSRKSKK